MFLKRPFRFHKRPQYNRYGRTDDDPIFPIISLAAALVGIISFALALTTFTPILFVLGIVSAILAIIFGGLGLRKRMNGLAIAGLSLGILEILAVIAWSILAIIAILSFAGC